MKPRPRRRSNREDKGASALIEPADPVSTDFPAVAFGSSPDPKEKPAMRAPTIEVIPLRPAVRADAPVTQDMMVRITPPAPDARTQRPAINHGLVLDRSGSMATQRKIEFARQAAIYAVEQLLPTDRVSVTVFDGKVNTLVPSTLAENKGPVVELVRGIRPGNGTALRGGWKEGGTQVRQHLLPGGLNRVILLSDGLANVGETNTGAIAADVNRLTREGVGTTTMGLGDEYNEDLMEAMARSGDGNYYYIESPEQLPDIFRTELGGLAATVGNTVSLGIEPQAGVTLADVLNDLDRLPTGRLKLPNLVAGMPVVVVVRLNVPPVAREGELCRFRVAWNAPGEPNRRAVTVALRQMPVAADAWELLAPTLEVWEQAALLLMARYKREATRCLERRDRDGAVRALGQARQLLASAPDTPEMRLEETALARIEEYLAGEAWEKFRKHAKYQASRRTQSKPYSSE